MWVSILGNELGFFLVSFNVAKGINFSDLLINALDPAHIEDTKKNPDLSKFRNAFSDHLVQALKALMVKKLKTITVVFDSIIDLPEEYTTELDTLIHEIEDEIEKTKLYSFINYHPEDLESPEEGK